MNKKAMMVVVGMLAFAEDSETFENQLVEVAVDVCGGQKQAENILTKAYDKLGLLTDDEITQLTKEVFRENLLLLVDSIS